MKILIGWSYTILGYRAKQHKLLSYIAKNLVRIALSTLKQIVLVRAGIAITTISLPLLKMPASNLQDISAPFLISVVFWNVVQAVSSPQ